MAVGDGLVLPFGFLTPEVFTGQGWGLVTGLLRDQAAWTHGLLLRLLSRKEGQDVTRRGIRHTPQGTGILMPRKLGQATQ